MADARAAGRLLRAKGLLEGVLAAAALDWRSADGARPFLHPGRAASVLIDGRDIGWVGELHPLVARAWALDRSGRRLRDRPRCRSRRAAPTEPLRGPDQLPGRATGHRGDRRRRPSSRRDRGRRACGPAAASCSRGAVFDLYRGEQVGEGSKSLALRLEFRSPDRTLTDDEVAALRERIEAAAAGEIGGRLRE